MGKDAGSFDDFHPILKEIRTESIHADVAIVAEHGPRSVAVYTGTCASRNPAAKPVLLAFLKALGSPMRFDSNTIDQPGKAVAQAMHGTWGAPPQGFDDADVALLIGGNPFVALSGGIPNPDPVRRVRIRVTGMAADFSSVNITVST